MYSTYEIMKKSIKHNTIFFNNLIIYSKKIFNKKKVLWKINNILPIILTQTFNPTPLYIKLIIQHLKHEKPPH